MIEFPLLESLWILKYQPIGGGWSKNLISYSQLWDRLIFSMVDLSVSNANTSSPCVKFVHNFENLTHHNKFIMNNIGDDCSIYPSQSYNLIFVWWKHHKCPSCFMPPPKDSVTNKKVKHPGHDSICEVCAHWMLPLIPYGCHHISKAKKLSSKRFQAAMPSKTTLLRL